MRAIWHASHGNTWHVRYRSLVAPICSSDGERVSANRHCYSWRPDYYGCLKLQFEAFLRSIEDGQPVMAPLSDALLAEKVVIAASESLKRGREVPLS